MVESINPPAWILLILWPFKGESCYPQIVGDLNEEFHQRVAEEGELAANRWYYREVCRNLRSMVFRWITIPAIAVPLFCLFVALLLHSVPRELSTSIHNWLIASPKYFWGLSSLSWSEILLGNVLGWSIIGLSLGILSSRVLRGHERLVRVVFGVCCLVFIGYMINYLGRWNFIYSDNAPIEYKILGDGAFYFKPLWTFTFIWMGSIWIERRHNRHLAA